MQCLCTIAPCAEIFASDILTDAQKLRLEFLDNALYREGIQRRSDSWLCFHFVMCDSDDLCISAVVTYLKKSKFLHENCAFDDGYSNAHRRMGKHTMRCLERCDYLSFLRRSVLLTSKTQCYPRGIVDKDVTTSLF